MGKPGRVLNLGNDHDIRDLKRELGDDFVLVKAANTFADAKQATPQKSTAAIKAARVTAPTDQAGQQASGQAAKPVTQRPTAQAKIVPVVEKPKKKKRLKASKDKGKPKWAKKSAE